MAVAGILNGLIGTLPGWITVAVIVGVALYVRRTGAPQAVTQAANASTQAIDILRDTNATLAEKIATLEGDNEEKAAQIRALTQQVALLEQRTSLEPMVASVIDQFVAHEARAQARHQGQLRILELVASRLGPDPNGGHAP